MYVEQGAQKRILSFTINLEGSFGYEQLIIEFFSCLLLDRGFVRVYGKFKGTRTVRESIQNIKNSVFVVMFAR